MGLGRKGTSWIVYAIGGLIIAVLFVTFAFNLTGGFLSEIPRTEGSIENSDSVVCFAGGSDDSVHCVGKVGTLLSGEEVFTFTKAPKWQGDAIAKPVLTNDAIYLAIGSHVCSYSTNGLPLWDACNVVSGNVKTDLVVGNGLVCFGTSNEYNCLNQQTGSSVFTIKADWSDCPGDSCKVQSTPAIVGDNIYVSLGHRVCKYSTFSSGALKNNVGLWGKCSAVVTFEGKVMDELDVPSREELQDELEHDDPDADVDSILPKPRNVEALDAGEDLVCWSTGDDKVVACANPETGDNNFISVKASKADSKPLVDGKDLYFVLGDKLYKWRHSEGNVFARTIAGKATTDLVLGESKVCLGTGEFVNCRDPTTLLNSFFVMPPRDADKGNACEWDSCQAKSTPAISEGFVYFGLGDHLCSYDIEKASVGEEFITAGNSDSEGWCVDFNEPITSGVAVLENE